jgi:hypothetical protein
MSEAFINRMPSEAEMGWIRLAFSSHLDGSGQQIESDGKHTRIGWREMERDVALVFNGINTENYGVFDAVKFGNNGRYGYSVKSYGTSSNIVLNKDTATGSMEITNRQNGFWTHLSKHGFTRKDCLDKSLTQRIGEQAVQVIVEENRKCLLEANIPAENAIYFFIAYTLKPHQRQYQLFAYPIDIFDNIKINWIIDGQSFKGIDPENGEMIARWTAMGRGQFCYSPRLLSAKYISPVFTLDETHRQTYKTYLQKKIREYYPEEVARLETLDPQHPLAEYHKSNKTKPFVL